MFQDVLGKAQEEKFMVSIATYVEEAAWVGYVLSYTLEHLTYSKAVNLSCSVDTKDFTLRVLF